MELEIAGIVIEHILNGFQDINDHQIKALK